MSYEYRIVSGSVIDGIEFERLCSEAMDDGYEPLGGIAISGPTALQAMVRKNEEDLI